MPNKQTCCKNMCLLVFTPCHGGSPLKHVWWCWLNSSYSLSTLSNDQLKALDPSSNSPPVEKWHPLWQMRPDPPLFTSISNLQNIRPLHTSYLVSLPGLGPWFFDVKSAQTISPSPARHMKMPKKWTARYLAFNMTIDKRTTTGIERQSKSWKNKCPN